MAILLVNTGRAITTGLVTGVTALIPKYLGWGTGAGTTGATDTTLFTEDTTGGYTRATCTMTQQTISTTNDTVQAVGTLTAGANLTLTNAGLFDAVTVGNLYMKYDFTGIPLSTNDSIQFTSQVQYS